MVNEAATSLAPALQPALPSEPVASRWRRWGWLAFQSALLLTFIVLAARQVSPAQLARDLANVRIEWLAVAFSIYLFTRIVNAWEWQVLLTKVGKAPIFGLLGILLIGTFVNAVLPGNLGDVAKIQIAANRYGLPRAGLVGSRGAEALINNIVFVVFVMLSIVLVRGAGFSQGSLAVAVGIAVALTGASMLLSRIFPEAMPERVARWLPSRLHNVTAEHWPRFYDGLETIRRPKLLGWLLLMNFFGWGVDIAVYFAYGQAFNLDVPFSAYVTITVALAVVTSVPITFGNIGTWEIALVGVMGLYDVPVEQALAFAAGAHLIISLFNITLGVLATAAMRVAFSDLLRLRGPQRQAPALAEAS